ncbi:hypothetical protein IWZ03DRAFT_390788 [Phyllosticta citriasiana]|uniref:NADH dehydrogenase subunit 5 n=1 Tax=Phyllosticta citriasiana TaxID=595635 RepID=A0ABR1K7R1_9PEZI
MLGVSLPACVLPYIPCHPCWIFYHILCVRNIIRAVKTYLHTLVFFFIDVYLLLTYTWG